MNLNFFRIRWLLFLLPVFVVLSFGFSNSQTSVSVNNSHLERQASVYSMVSMETHSSHMLTHLFDDCFFDDCSVSLICSPGNLNEPVLLTEFIHIYQYKLPVSPLFSEDRPPIFG